MKRIAFIVGFIILALAGVGTAAKLAATDEQVNCATTTNIGTALGHVMGDNGVPVYTAPDQTITAIASVCVTATNQTVPGPTTTVTNSTTVTTTPPPTTSTTTPVTTTTTPTGAAPSFDGRANQMTSLGCNPNSQSPYVWGGLGYINCDISLVNDSRYGKVYRYHINEASKAPYYDPGANKGADELGRVAYAHAGDSFGKWDWYALAIKLDPSWVQPTWNTLFEPNFPRYTSPPESINTAYRNNSNGSVCWTYSTIGSCTLYWDLFRYNGAVGSLVRQDRWLMPVEKGKWVEFVLGVKWATNTTGAYKIYTRTEGESGFTLRDQQTNVNTYQSSGTNNPANTTDIQMLYSGTEPGNGWPSPLWDNVAYHNGVRVYANEQDALNAFN
jgi:hypothetical protein